jgi:CheY-like chemotaxis protein
MIVDDNAQMRSLIRTLLDEVAHEFIECADGGAAVAAFGTERPDWAVMDVAMQPMDGLTATRLITAKFPGSHILIVTHHDNPKLRECAHEAGAEGFLLKEDLTQLPAMLGAEQNGKPEPKARWRAASPDEPSKN